MKLFLIIIFIIFIILLFYIINLYLKKKKFNEFFVTEESVLVCGKQNDICKVENSTGKNSCCDGYSCILPKGDFQYKICAKDNIFSNLSNISPGSGLLNLGKFGLKELGLLNLKLPQLKLPNFNANVDICSALVGSDNINNQNINYFNILDEEE